jgi:hypothetical protein
MVVKGGRLQGGYKRKCYAGHKHDHRKGDPLLAFFYCTRALYSEIDLCRLMVI